MEHMQVLAFLAADGSHSRMREAFPDAPKQPLKGRAARRARAGERARLRVGTATVLRRMADRLEPTPRGEPAPHPA